jgi:hypothetical protein
MSTGADLGPWAVGLWQERDVVVDPGARRRPDASAGTVARRTRPVDPARRRIWKIAATASRWSSSSPRSLNPVMPFVGEIGEVLEIHRNMKRSLRSGVPWS